MSASPKCSEVGGAKGQPLHVPEGQVLQRESPVMGIHHS